MIKLETRDDLLTLLEEAEYLECGQYMYEKRIYSLIRRGDTLYQLEHTEHSEHGVIFDDCELHEVVEQVVTHIRYNSVRRIR